MATVVVNTTEQEVLNVVRFTAKLAWANAGPEVARTEVTRLCLKARGHILAGRWLDMASLMLASVDLLLTSPSLVVDEDLEDVLSVICSLVTKAGSEDQEITNLICGKLTQQPGHKPMLRLRVLLGLYNFLPSPYGKAFVYKYIILTFEVIDIYVNEWGIGNLEQRELYLAISSILKDQKGMAKEYFNFLNKYLATFKGSDGESATIGDAKEVAVAAIIEFIKSPNLFQCDLLNMPAVSQLEKDDKYQLVYELLMIFLTKRLDPYLEFLTANSALLKDYGLVHKECVTKMRLMCLLYLSRHYDGLIPYSAIAFELRINDDEVEQWIIKAIASKILDCKVDQLNQTVIVRSEKEKLYPHVFFDMTVGGQPVGRIVMRLYKEHAPKTVENFRALCTGEVVGKSGTPLHYKGSVFHSVIPGYMCQGGDITHGNGTGGKSIYEDGPFCDEINNLKHIVWGVLSMCNGGPNANTSQFFISTRSTIWLDKCHTVFGRVIEGFDVIMAIEAVGSRAGTTTEEVKIAHCDELLHQMDLDLL